MTRRDLYWRLSGAALFLAACGTSLIHKQVISRGLDAMPSALEACLALTTFLLASLGVVLLVNGARLRDSWRTEAERARRHRSGSPRDGEASRARIARSDPATSSYRRPQ